MMKMRKLYLACFLLVTVGGSSVLALLPGRVPASQGTGFSALHGGFSGPTGHYLFGTSSTNFNGWLMPAGVLVVMSFVAKDSLNHFVGATLNVFPYEMKQNSFLYLGLYVNGQLSASQHYDLSSSRAHPAAIVQSLSSSTENNFAKFSHSLEGYTVALALNNALPAGTTITFTAFVTNPIWVQTADNPTVQAYALTTA